MINIIRSSVTRKTESFSPRKLPTKRTNPLFCPPFLSLSLSIRILGDARTDNYFRGYSDDVCDDFSATFDIQLEVGERVQVQRVYPKNKGSHELIVRECLERLVYLLKHPSAGDRQEDGSRVAYNVM